MSRRFREVRFREVEKNLDDCKMAKKDITFPSDDGYDDMKDIVFPDDSGYDFEDGEDPKDIEFPDDSGL